MIVWKALVVWLAQLVTVVLLGGLRDAMLAPRLGEHRAHQVETLLASAAVFAVIWLLLPWLRVRSAAQALALGAGWVALALAFEFGFFHYARGVPWETLLADYDVRSGRLLIVLWGSVLLSPVAGWGAGRR